jgi:hypothetical protein
MAPGWMNLWGRPSLSVDTRELSWLAIVLALNSAIRGRDAALEGKKNSAIWGTYTILGLNDLNLFR